MLVDAAGICIGAGKPASGSCGSSGPKPTPKPTRQPTARPASVKVNVSFSGALTRADALQVLR